MWYTKSDAIRDCAKQSAERARKENFVELMTDLDKEAADIKSNCKRTVPRCNAEKALNKGSAS